MLKVVLSISKEGDKYEVVLKVVFRNHYYSTLFMQSFTKRPTVAKVEIVDSTSGTLKRYSVSVNGLDFWVDEVEIYGRTQKV